MMKSKAKKTKKLEINIMKRRYFKKKQKNIDNNKKT